MQVRHLPIRRPVTVSPFQSTDDVIELMWRHDIRHALVTDRQGLAGLVSDTDLLESVGMLLRSERIALGTRVSTESLIVADVMEVRCTCVTANDPVTDAAQWLLLEQRSALPVVGENGYLGIVTDRDLLELFAGTCTLHSSSPHREPVVHYGSRMVRTVRPHDDLATASARLSGGKVRHLIVTQANRFIGMLSDWDIRLAIGEAGTSGWMERPVSDYMATGLQTLRPRDTLACAAQVVRLEKLCAVPITTRENELIGTITVADLLRALAWPAPVHV